MLYFVADEGPGSVANVTLSTSRVPLQLNPCRQTEDLATASDHERLSIFGAMDILARPSLSLLADILIVGLVLVVPVVYFSGGKRHPQEPPIIQPWVPVIGHLLGMLMEGGHYVKRIRSVCMLRKLLMTKG